MKFFNNLFHAFIIFYSVLVLILSISFVPHPAKAQNIGNGTHLLRKSTTMPDGRIKVGDLVVQEGEGSREAKVKTIKLDAKVTAKEGWITMSELGQISIGRSELNFAESQKPDDDKLYFGVSVDNKLLILVKGKGNKVKVVRDHRGIYDIENIDKQKVVLVNGIRMPDGRIKVEK